MFCLNKTKDMAVSKRIVLFIFMGLCTLLSIINIILFAVIVKKSKELIEKRKKVLITLKD